MLIWAAPYAKDFTGKKQQLVHYSFQMEYIVFTSVVFSVLFKDIRNRIRHYTAFDSGMIKVLFGIMPLMCVIIIIYIFTATWRNMQFGDRLERKKDSTFINILNIMAFISFDILPPLQLITLFYAFGVARGTFLVAGVLPVIVILARFDWNFICGENGLKCKYVAMRTVWLIFTLMTNVILAYFYIMTLENEEDRAGWACLIVFLQVLWAVNNFRRAFNHLDFHSNLYVYLFASVAVVLISAIALMTELILKTVNGERSVGDLRIVVFSCESLVVICLFILPICERDESSQTPSPSLKRQHSFTQRYYDRSNITEDVEMLQSIFPAYSSH
ncbi:uncharacterized protein LOC127653204 isoform X2 [Xyrauchen texanus]|uniref:uncharacterized protein LOC127653204 isoform X2 n=1 Tax=Xyrauchen texanus TaxID=154827 RepID=UPI002241AFD4|nr:uncharacterized protein LOC127653204 isoform X2 [Xyrauchen texanus]